MVELAAVNRSVVGSNPTLGAIFNVSFVQRIGQGPSKPLM
jgi:hypothetical protein